MEESTTNTWVNPQIRNKIIQDDIVNFIGEMTALEQRMFIKNEEWKKDYDSKLIRAYLDNAHKQLIEARSWLKEARDLLDMDI